MTAEGRLPVEPLLRGRSVAGFCLETGLAEATVRDRMESGLSSGEADVWAALLGLHVDNVSGWEGFDRAMGAEGRTEFILGPSAALNRVVDATAIRERASGLPAVEEVAADEYGTPEVAPWDIEAWLRSEPVKFEGVMVVLGYTAEGWPVLEVEGKEGVWFMVRPDGEMVQVWPEGRGPNRARGGELEVDPERPRGGQ